MVPHMGYMVQQPAVTAKQAVTHCQYHVITFLMKHQDAVSQYLYFIEKD
jgi:hypothetical protein